MSWKDNFPQEHRCFETENGILYNADCLDIMSLMEDKSVDLVLTDPPYGIKRDKGFGGFEGFGGFGKPIFRNEYKDNWDDNIPCKLIFDCIVRIGTNQMIFGGNYFAHILPKSTHWIFWDKQQTMPTFGDGELIWTSFPQKSIKKIVFQYNGLLSDSKDKREHPTQKPTEFIIKLLKKYETENNLVLDPFLGSGTTALACEKLNRKWIGIEISEKYCKIAKQRIIDYNKQLKIF